VYLEKFDKTVNKKCSITENQLHCCEVREVNNNNNNNNKSIFKLRV